MTYFIISKINYEVIVAAGCIHTINDMDEETENVTYTTQNHI